MTGKKGLLMGAVLLLVSSLLYPVNARGERIVEIDSFDKGLTAWTLDPPADVQKHRMRQEVVAGKAPANRVLCYETGGEGSLNYFQITNKSIGARAGQWSGMTALRFRFKGDGSDAVAAVYFFEKDGSRWRHDLPLSSRDWQNIIMPLNAFKYELGNDSRGTTSLNIQNAQLMNICILKDARQLPHVMMFDDMVLIGTGEDAARAAAPAKDVKPARKGIEIAIHPASSHRHDRTYLIRDEITPLSFFFWNNKSTETPRLLLDLPPEVQFAYAYEGSEFEGKTYGSKPASSILPNGHTRWSLPLTPDLITQDTLSKFQKHLRVFLTPSKEKNAASPVISWQVVDSSAVLNQGRLEAEILPAMEDAFATRTQFYLYENSMLNAPDVAVREKILHSYVRSGLSGSTAYTSADTTAWLNGKNWQVFAMMGWWHNWGANVSDFTGITEDIRVTLADGTKSSLPAALCQTYLLANSQENSPYFKAAVRNLRSLYVPGMAGFVNDYEMEWDGDFSPLNGCFCPRCMDAFSIYSHVNKSGLSPDLIRQKHKKKWLEFRHSQNARMMEIYTRAVKAVDPQLSAIVCSYPLQRDRISLPLDIGGFDSWIDGHWPQCYTSKQRLYDEVEYSTRNLKTQVVPVLMTFDPVGERAMVPSIEDFRMNILATASAGAKGMVFFTGSTTMDGQLLKNLYDVRKDLRQLEPFFLDGSRADSQIYMKGIPEKTVTENIFGKTVTFSNPQWEQWLRYKVHTLGDRQLISLFNYNPDKTAFVSLRTGDLTKSRYYIRDVSGNQLLTYQSEDSWPQDAMKKGFVYRIKPLQTVFLMLDPERPATEPVSRVTQDELQDQFQKAKKETEQKQRSAGAEKENMTAAYTKEPPVLDGKLDDACWKDKSYWKNSFITPAGTLPGEQSRMAVCYDDKALYLAVECDDGTIVANLKNHDDQLWIDDCIEIFLSPDSVNYYHLIVNAGGARYDAYNGKSEWNGQWEARTSVDAERKKWTAEIRLPLSNFVFKTEPLINVCRENWPQSEISSLFRTGVSFHEIGSLRPLKLGQ